MNDNDQPSAGFPQVDVISYMNGSIRNIMAAAYRNVLSNPREAKFAWRMQRLFARSVGRRKAVLKEEGIEVPPFLISSIATACNLHCKGCYARSNGIAADEGAPAKQSLSPEQWKAVFTEAAGLGVNFSLLAGGEPLMRRDILEAVAEVKDMIFPIFTNGTLIGHRYLEFFREHLNMIPVISIEGTAVSTDERRGQGVFQRALKSMEMLKGEDLFFGASITVTIDNYRLVTSPGFIDSLRGYGCKIVFYVEYVPTEEGTEHLAFGEAEVAEMERLMELRRAEYSDIIFLSFPGDEKALGGCLASGRGFFHIGPDGAAEPCPFSPFSDGKVTDIGIRGALRSPLFRALRNAHALGWEHTGGCTLFEHREEVEAILRSRFESARILLRPWTEDDAEALFKYAQDPEVGPRAGWPPHKSVDESREVIRNVFSGEGMWAVVWKESSEPIGCVGYLPAASSNLAIEEDQAEVGYWIAKPFWDRGICTEALEMVIDYCFSVKGFTTLWGDYFPDNPASGKVMAKCGFVDTGREVLCPNLEVGADRPVRVMKLVKA